MLIAIGNADFNWKIPILALTLILRCTNKKSSYSVTLYHNRDTGQQVQISQIGYKVSLYLRPPRKWLGIFTQFKAGATDF